jgi:hypothetical protein
MQPAQISQTKRPTTKKYDAYAADAYHSLLRNAMAACGYWQAFRAVRKSVERAAGIPAR